MNEKLLDGRTVAILVSNGFDEVEFTDPQKRLIELGEYPLIGTSANRSGFPACTSAEEVSSQLKDDVDIVIDGYNRSENLASTIVHCLTEPFQILRQGAISLKELNHICKIQE